MQIPVLCCQHAATPGLENNEHFFQCRRHGIVGRTEKEATCLVVYQGGENTLKFELVRSLS